MSEFTKNHATAVSILENYNGNLEAVITRVNRNSTACVHPISKHRANVIFNILIDNGWDACSNLYENTGFHICFTCPYER